MKLAIRNDTNVRGWMRIASAAEYLDVSVRTVRRLLPEGLPHVRIPGTGTILVNVGQLDGWLLRGQGEGEAGEDELVSKIIQKVRA